MAAPYTIAGNGVYFRSIESESPSSVVWYRGNSYSVETYREKLEPAFPADVFRQDLLRALSSDQGFFVPALTSSGQKNPFLKLEFTSYDGGYIYLMTGSARPISDSAGLSESDFVTGVRYFSGGIVETVDPGPIFGGTGYWDETILAIDIAASTGSAFLQSHSTQASIDQYPLSPEISFQDNGYVNLEATITDAGPPPPTPTPFPPDRPVTYPPDSYWNPSTGSWTPDPWDLTTLGGGSYRRHLTVVGHKKIYFAEI